MKKSQQKESTERNARSKTRTKTGGKKIRGESPRIQGSRVDVDARQAYALINARSPAMNTPKHFVLLSTKAPSIMDPGRCLSANNDRGSGYRERVCIDTRERSGFMCVVFRRRLFEHVPRTLEQAPHRSLGCMVSASH